MRLLIASSNLGKIREIQAILAKSAVEVLSFQDVGLPTDFDVAETGETLEENAWLKASAYATATGLTVLADDSGLEVLALKGFPGVYSNRWFVGTTSERNQALLAKLSPTDSRQAQFRSVLCLYDPQSKQRQFFEGVIKGILATAERGNRLEGFGYDPIFIPEGYTQTFAELGVAVKNQISHRRQALLKLSQFVLTNTRPGQPE